MGVPTRSTGTNAPGSVTAPVSPPSQGAPIAPPAKPFSPPMPPFDLAPEEKTNPDGIAASVIDAAQQTAAAPVAAPANNGIGGLMQAFPGLGTVVTVRQPGQAAAPAAPVVTAPVMAPVAAPVMAAAPAPVMAPLTLPAAPAATPPVAAAAPVSPAPTPASVAIAPLATVVAAAQKSPTAAPTPAPVVNAPPVTTATAPAGSMPAPAVKTVSTKEALEEARHFLRNQISVMVGQSPKALRERAVEVVEDLKTALASEKQQPKLKELGEQLNAVETKVVETLADEATTQFDNYEAGQPMDWDLVEELVNALREISEDSQFCPTDSSAWTLRDKAQELLRVLAFQKILSGIRYTSVQQAMLDIPSMTRDTARHLIAFLEGDAVQWRTHLSSRNKTLVQKLLTELKARLAPKPAAPPPSTNQTLTQWTRTSTPAGGIAAPVAPTPPPLPTNPPAPTNPTPPPAHNTQTAAPHQPPPAPANADEALKRDVTQTIEQGREWEGFTDVKLLFQSITDWNNLNTRLTSIFTTQHPAVSDSEKQEAKRLQNKIKSRRDALVAQPQTTQLAQQTVAAPVQPQQPAPGPFAPGAGAGAVVALTPQPFQPAAAAPVQVQPQQPGAQFAPPGAQTMVMPAAAPPKDKSLWGCLLYPLIAALFVALGVGGMYWYSLPASETGNGSQTAGNIQQPVQPQQPVNPRVTVLIPPSSMQPAPAPAPSSGQWRSVTAADLGVADVANFPITEVNGAGLTALSAMHCSTGALPVNTAGMANASGCVIPQ